jgi:hypothetical protein
VLQRLTSEKRVERRKKREYTSGRWAQAADGHKLPKMVPDTKETGRGVAR